MVTLRRATSDDVPFILATERHPGYDVLVGASRKMSTAPISPTTDWAYFIGLDEAGARQGFAILQNRNTRDGNEFLRRIAVTNAGRGFGKPFLSTLIDWVFAHSDTPLFSACPQ